MGTAERRQFTAEQKAHIVRRHLVDGVAVSDLCDEHKIAPSTYIGTGGCGQFRSMLNLRSSGSCGQAWRSAA